MDKKNTTNTVTETTVKPQTDKVEKVEKTSTPVQQKASGTPQKYSRKKYFLYAPGKGFVSAGEKGVPTFGVDANVTTYDDMRMVKFVRNFFVNTLKLTDELLVMTVVG